MLACACCTRRGVRGAARDAVLTRRVQYAHLTTRAVSYTREQLVNPHYMPVYPQLTHAYVDVCERAQRSDK
eukprot:3867170-Pleurochrysis_carterae.AAC.1